MLKKAIARTVPFHIGQIQHHVISRENIRESRQSLEGGVAATDMLSNVNTS